MSAVNRQCRLAARPSGLPERGDFQIADEPIAEPGDGEVRVAVQYVSLDPAMRGWMSDIPSYMPPVGVGEVMRAGAVGRVTASRHPRVEVGDHVTGMLGVQDP